MAVLFVPVCDRLPATPEIAWKRICKPFENRRGIQPAKKLQSVRPSPEHPEQLEKVLKIAGSEQSRKITAG
jgi:hypothetical protein